MKQSPSFSISHKGQPTQLLNSRPAAICAIAALLFLQGCAAGYVPVESSTPRYISPVAYRPVPLPGYVVVQPQQPVQIYTSEQLDQLAGPVALYPDPLLAQLLPASTYPLDIVRAAQLVRASPTEDQINAQDWDASVKAIAHYPAVLQYMDANLEWTQQLGQAFIAQPDDLMQSVQRLRQQASNLGNLITTPEQQVVIEQSYVRIIPAQPEIIYIPVYQPQVVYYQPASFITFGIGCHLGSWLDLDCDWNQHCVYRPGWTWNHWHHHNIHIEHHHVTHFERHDYRHGERPSSEWHRDSSRPQRAPARPRIRSRSC